MTMDDTLASRTYDTLHMGRSCIDLYSNDVGAPFAEITSFAAYVGGSPTNISVGAQRNDATPFGSSECLTNQRVPSSRTPQDTQPESRSREARNNSPISVRKVSIASSMRSTVISGLFIVAIRFEALREPQLEQFTVVRLGFSGAEVVLPK